MRVRSSKLGVEELKGSKVQGFKGSKVNNHSLKKSKERGLVLVNTGNGKGKTTAALGTAIRACGYGKKVIMIQFIKGTIKSGEIIAAEKLFPLLTIVPVGRGFYKIRGDIATESEHYNAAQEALNLAKKAIHSGKYFLVILDEINVAIKLKLVALDDVLELIDTKPLEVHLFLTGRGAHKEIKKRANLVTEMRTIKHPYDAGITAQKGIDY